MKAKLNNSKRRIYLIDDHAILRNGLRHLIEADPTMIVCGECDGKRAVSRMEETKPELVIVDISLPAMNGIELIKNLRSRFSWLRFLVLSMHDEALYAERALRAGASGYVMKGSSPEDLLTAIHKVLGGEVYASSALSSLLIQNTAGNKPSESAIEKLSDRELEIVQLIGQGLSTSEISQRLGISKKTVETHRGNIRRKLELQTGAELTRFALANRKE